METITFPQLAGFAALVLALVGAYNAVMSAVKTYRDEKAHKNKPVADLEDRLDKYDKYFSADKRRFEAIESDIEATKKENRMQMKMLLALVRHSIDGNNIDGLKNMRDEVQEYLVDK